MPGRNAGNIEAACACNVMPRLLVVDDHHDARSAMSKYLTDKGFVVVEVGNGRKAVDMLRNGEPFSALLTDLSLPDLDGREVAREARTISPTIWCALITGWDVAPEDLAPWGINRLFTKPVDLAELYRSLLAVLNMAQTDSTELDSS